MSVMLTQGVSFLETKITASSKGLSETIIEMINSFIAFTLWGQSHPSTSISFSFWVCLVWLVLVLHSGASQSLIPNRNKHTKKHVSQVYY